MGRAKHTAMSQPGAPLLQTIGQIQELDAVWTWEVRAAWVGPYRLRDIREWVGVSYACHTACALYVSYTLHHSWHAMMCGRVVTHGLWLHCFRPATAERLSSD